MINNKYYFTQGFVSKMINYKIRKLAKIDRHEEFVAADFYM